VPYLEYSGEDIFIEARLVVKRGNQPLLYGIMCNKTDPEACRQEVRANIDTYSLNSNESIDLGYNYTLGREVLQTTILKFEHDEEICKN
jgi:hypothetical protein